MSATAPLPCRAPLEAYARQAESLLSAVQAGDEGAAWRFKWQHPRFRGRMVGEVNGDTLALDDAKLVVAHDYAFGSWADLERFAQDMTTEGSVARFEDAVEAVVSGDLQVLRTMLEKDPGLVRARSSRRHHATLLHYVAANGVEDARQKTPPNAVEVARLLLDAGADVDALADMYDAKCTTMSMLVSSAHPAGAGLQVPLAEVLLDHGAAFEGPGSNWQSALLTALAFGYLETARALTRRGAPVDTLPAAAGLGSLDKVGQLLPAADLRARHIGLALAAQHGHVEVVRVLLDAGVPSSRYNPEGYHSHSTPLHQAVWSDHLQTVRLLVERGARMDIRDTIYGGTPLDWAVHGGRTAIANFLRGQPSQQP